MSQRNAQEKECVSGRDNDMEVGYLKRATEENTYQIRKFYDLLENHMEGEENKFKSIDKKLFLITAVCMYLAGKDLPWSELSALLLKFL